MTEHHVETARQEVHPGLEPVALDEPDPLTDPGGLGFERLARRGHHLGIGLQPGHGVPGACQPERLGALAHADVQDPQPLPDRVAGGQLFVELP